ncbi:PP2C family serine/threonine-protein phosphatase [Spongiibacter sp.]|uniref:PP2C family protein-serine/threonine phosphatase n=1 Tax=Spongiibacter sp. TaxID=2024860 RepID=UPI00356B32A1
MPKIYGKTHIGRRSTNEDRFVADSGWGIALITDGMGGPASGEVAASIVSAQLVDNLDNDIPLVNAIIAAHEDVQRGAQDGRGKPGMGATIVVAHFRGHDFELAWLGDSRAYLWHGELRQLSRDHSRVEQLLATGDITLPEAQQHKSRHLITHALGHGTLGVDDIPLLHSTLYRGQQLLLCSDGLNDVLSGVQIARVMSRKLNPNEKLAHLVEQAYQSGGSDNITAVIVDADDDAPDGSSADLLPAVFIARADGFSQYFKP